MFKLSNRPLNEGLVRLLRSIPWEDPQVLKAEKERRAQLAKPISLKEYSFGRFCRDGTFLTQVDESRNTANIACDLDRRQVRLTVTLGDHSNDIFKIVLMPKVAASYSPPQIKRVFTTGEIPGVLLVSDTPPIVESYNDVLVIAEVPPTRRQSLGTQSLLPMCHSLLATFDSFDDRDTFVERCRLLRLPSAAAHDNLVCTPYVSSEEQLGRLDHLLGKLGFRLAFEIEKAFAEAVLEPLEILSMEDDLMRLSSDQPVDAAAAFRYFLTTISGRHQLVTSRRRRRKRKRRHADGSGEPEPTSMTQQLRTAFKAYLSEQGGKQPVDSNPPFESYHLIVTPTSRVLEGPLPDQSNSVLRRFENHECFLRVSIQEEHKSKIRRDPTIDLGDILRTRFRPFLLHGLRLAGRPYEFLGYSMSGLKEHSVWFVTPFTQSSGGELNAATIREKLVSYVNHICETYVWRRLLRVI
jgi:RNA-dependent RNA polymerase